MSKLAELKGKGSSGTVTVFADKSRPLDFPAGARGRAVNIHSGVTVNRRPALRSAYHLRAPDYYKKIDLDKFVTAEKESLGH